MSLYGKRSIQTYMNHSQFPLPTGHDSVRPGRLESLNIPRSIRGRLKYSNGMKLINFRAINSKLIMGGSPGILNEELVT